MTYLPMGTASEQFIDALPPGYELIEKTLAPGFISLQALVYEQRPAAG
jgi:hypothetical protein